MSNTIMSEMTFVDFYKLAKTHGNGKPLKRILSLVEKEGCTEVRKSEVEDCEGWNAEWEIQYQFMRSPKTALKFDFYAKNEEYLGFVILRPSYFTVCNSFIRIPTKSTKKSSYFVTCKNSFQGIEGVPFIQQDLMTGRCAHACLSMISKTLNLKAGKPFLTFKLNFCVFLSSIDFA